MRQVLHPWLGQMPGARRLTTQEARAEANLEGFEQRRLEPRS